MKDESRSAFLVDAARQLAQQRERDKRDLRDTELLDAKADALNDEALSDLTLVSELFQESGKEQP